MPSFFKAMNDVGLGQRKSGKKAHENATRMVILFIRHV